MNVVFFEQIFRALLLLTILAFAISQDVKGLKAPQGKRRSRKT